MLVSPPQAKKLVESLPQVLQKEVGKEEALRLKAVLEAAGGTVELDDSTAIIPIIISYR